MTQIPIVSGEDGEVLPKVNTYVVPPSEKIDLRILNEVERQPFTKTGQ